MAGGAALSYAALTSFRRRQGLGQKPVVAAGQYDFQPGVEMQHDTSPHTVEIGGVRCKARTASAVLCYSRLLYFQIYLRFQRFDCKDFLTAALRYAGGATERVMIDNTHVVVLRGSGSAMVPVPEMDVFAERFGFRFVAREIGDANRSGRVERPFHFIGNNFLAGRAFRSWEDMNQQARQWCGRVNATYKKHIRAVPRELFAIERVHLKPPPEWIPEVYRLHPRTVDVEGYVSVNSNRYSVPAAWIGRRVEVRETQHKIEIELDARHLVAHARVAMPQGQRITLAAHRPPRGEGVKRGAPHPEELAKNLKLKRILSVYEEQLRAAEKADATHSEFLAGLLRAQWHHWRKSYKRIRQESALERRIQRADLPERWSLETFPYARQPGVNRKQIRAFAELDFAAKHENPVFSGPTGVGKTGLASGILLKAIENGLRCQFVRAQDLFDEMYASLADRSTRKLLNRLARLDVILIDEFGYLNLKPEQSNTFFKLMEERYRRHSTIITTNLVYDEWHNFLGNKALVDALLSRVPHYCHTVVIAGPSIREPQG